jgi:hypothetical protein
MTFSSLFVFPLALLVVSVLAISRAQPASSLVINEIYYDAPGEDRGCFVELRGVPGTKLEGLTLVTFNAKGNDAGTVLLSGTISASGYFVIGQDGSAPNRDAVNAFVNLTNGGGAVQLKRGSSVLDAIAYGEAPSTGAKARGEGRTAVDAKSGQGLARTPDGADSNDNAKDFRVGKPTSGQTNSGQANSGQANSGQANSGPSGSTASETSSNPNQAAPASSSKPTEIAMPVSNARKVVLFDLSKREASGNADWRIDGAYSSWADELRRQGFEPRSITQNSISGQTLIEANVLVIPEPQNPFSDGERQAILAFVQRGGGLLMIADHRESDRDNDGWDSPEVFNGWDGKTPSNAPNEYRKSLDAASSFGLSFSFASGFRDPVITIKPLVMHSVVDGLSSAGIYVGTSLEKGTALMGANGKTYLAISEIGKGRVLGYGDSSAFSDGTFSDGTKSKYNNWVNLSNARLAINAVKWLAQDLQ